MPFVHRLGERVGDAGTHADQCRLLDAELARDLIPQRSGPIQGASGSPGTATMVSKQAQIGMITTPSFLADVKK